MALFAANNIARAIVTNSFNGVMLAGLVANVRSSDPVRRERIHAFARALGTTVVMTLERSTLITESELQLRTAVESAPESDVAMAFRGLADYACSADPARLTIPTPFGQEAFFDFMRE